MNIPSDKQCLRETIRKRRIDLSDRGPRSERIQQSAWELPHLRLAQQVMIYVGHRSEVQTGTLLSLLLDAGKSVCVPWCDGDELKLFRTESIAELQPGAFGIPEPPTGLKERPERAGQASDLDLVLVPGIAFDRNGHRLGQGQGFYDRLLSEVSNSCVLIGLAFDVQMVEQVPVETHDVSLDLIVTESGILRTA